MRPGQGRNHLTKTARTILEGAAFSEGGGPIQGAAHMTNGFSMLVKLYYQFLKNTLFLHKVYADNWDGLKTPRAMVHGHRNFHISLMLTTNFPN